MPLQKQLNTSLTNYKELPMSVDAVTAKEYISDCIECGLVPFIKGSPGIGKSAIIKGIAKDFSLKVIDMRLSQCDPTDMNGFPRIDGIHATYAPMDTFPLESTPLPKGKEGWLLFLDEFNSAPLSVQAAAYKLVLDKEVGQYRMHPNVVVVCAGNLETDNAIVNTISTAMQSRVVHIELHSNHEQWDAWAAKADIHHFIRDYIKYKPETINNFDPEHTDNTFACERTWEFASNLIKQWGGIIPVAKVALLSGTIGKGIANEFFQYTKVYKDLPTVAQIAANPKNTKVPQDPGTLYAVTGTIAANVDSTIIGPVMEYINRLPLEFQVITLKELIAKDPAFSADVEVKKWIKKNMSNLF
jgi:hypothetical protein